MTPSARLSAIIEILTQLSAAWEKGDNFPADALLNKYFRNRRFMGSKDRQYVARLAYFILRHGGTLEWHLEQARLESTPRRLAFLALIFSEKLSRKEIESMCNAQRYAPKPLDIREQMLIERAEASPFVHEDMPNWARYNIPQWAEERLQQQFGETLSELMAALNEEAPVDIRINTLKTTRADTILALDKDGIQSYPCPHSPLGIRIPHRAPIFSVSCFKEGWFEMQDEGSQIVAALAEASSGDRVIDFCAGAGGKTLAIAAHMKNKGRILALDISERRLKQMKPRLARAGVHNVAWQAISSETDTFLKRHHATADWVIVDAPCSGSGTWRRNPDLKWRFSERDITELTDLQKRILNSSWKLVKPGGILLYITCSLFEEENDAQVKRLCVDNPNAQLLDSSIALDGSRRWIDGVGAAIQLLPHHHLTDGFFAAKIQKSLAS